MKRYVCIHRGPRTFPTSLTGDEMTVAYTEADSPPDAAAQAARQTGKTGRWQAIEAAGPPEEFTIRAEQQYRVETLTEPASPWELPRPPWAY